MPKDWREVRSLLLSVEKLIEGVGSVLLTSRCGSVVVWSRLMETEDPIELPIFEDDHLIPEWLRRQDDEAVAGDPELDELLVAMTSINRLSRKFVPRTFVSQHLERSDAAREKFPVFRIFGDACVFSCYALGHHYLLAFYSDKPSLFQGLEQERIADSKLDRILRAISALLYSDEYRTMPPSDRTEGKPRVATKPKPAKKSSSSRAAKTPSGGASSSRKK